MSENQFLGFATVFVVGIVGLIVGCSSAPAPFPTLPPPIPTSTSIPPTPTATFTPTPQSLSRHTEDLPDDLAGKQVRILYVLPSDSTDRNLDTNGTITTSVGAWQQWLAEQTGGRALRVDTYQGMLDIGFLRLGMTNAGLHGLDTDLIYQIKVELQVAGLEAPEKILALYYEGSHQKTCGEATSWLGVLYLMGHPPREHKPCSDRPFTTDVSRPSYKEWGMLHEILHAMGIVPDCAPNNIANLHVSDDNHDLMYTGDLPWYPTTLDVNHDDYYQHDNPDCFDLDDSGWLTP